MELVPMEAVVNTSTSRELQLWCTTPVLWRLCGRVVLLIAQFVFPRYAPLLTFWKSAWMRQVMLWQH